MTGTGSPCGACKFLRRKCMRGCVFAPYFCHEQGASHFAAIHKVFGASNVSKLLAQLPVSDRSEAAVTISYEALARIQDPIYGCVSHIFALQQQVVNLQVQLASLKEQASQSFFSGSGSSGNPNYDTPANIGKFYPSDSPLDVQNWFQSENASMIPPFDHPISSRNINGDFMINPNSSSGNYENSAIPQRENVSFSSLEDQGSTYTMYSLDDMQTSNCQWTFRDDLHDLQSAALGYIQY
ncbi:LOB domain-containing protein [Heracleum sosnowskyi]|uniref:LOB domain-containing protein n=1 Tax=Heracleum sosnowskyi TaxID=360622 RepID=A0AAD8J7W9_9APIA|nr:LOB domain-containing protein [Heracleum sosnowskyi]